MKSLPLIIKVNSFDSYLWTKKFLSGSKHFIFSHYCYKEDGEKRQDDK